MPGALLLRRRISVLGLVFLAVVVGAAFGASWMCPFYRLGGMLLLCASVVGGLGG